MIFYYIRYIGETRSLSYIKMEGAVSSQALEMGKQLVSGELIPCELLVGRWKVNVMRGVPLLLHPRFCPALL